MDDEPKYTFVEAVPVPVLSFAPQSLSITFTCGGGEMLRMTPAGFYVRGVRLEQDEKEAKSIYNAMVAFLVAHKML